MAYINKREINALHAAHDQFQELIEGGAEDTDHYNGILKQLASLIEKANKDQEKMLVKKFLKVELGKGNSTN